jgi:glycosyltransferase involved in cell wall biosynthesis
MLVRDLIARRSRLAKTAWIELIERSNLKHAAAIHLTSQIEALELESFRWQLPRRAVIPNGIEEPAVPDEKLATDIREIAAEQPLVLFFGRLSWKKGLDRLLRAFARTRSGKLAIVGTDDEDYASQLQAMAETLHIGDRVRFLPRTIVGREKEQLFAAATVFVLPSYSENFGNTVLEAMRRGVPVVVTPEVGAAEVVRQSGGGLVVEGEPEPLGAAIGTLADGGELARSMGESGKRYVVANCTWPIIAMQMESLYVSLALERRELRRIRTT